MAIGQKISFRAYSFSVRKWRAKNPEKVYPLNKRMIFEFRDEEGDDVRYEYDDYFELLGDFLAENAVVDDREDSKQLFSCLIPHNHTGETSNFRYQFFVVNAGYYGYASNLVDRNTKSVVHRKSRDEADVKPFYVMVVVPKDTQIKSTTRGLIFFQEIGIYGIKTITTNMMQEYYSKKLGVSFVTKNLIPGFYLKKLFDNGILQKIKVARSIESADAADRLYGAGYAHEERVLTPIRFTDEMRRKLKRVSESRENYFSLDGHSFTETKITVKIGDRVRTIDLHHLDDLSVEEALPDELLLADGTINYNAFKAHMIEVAEEYIAHIPS